MQKHIWYNLEPPESGPGYHSFAVKESILAFLTPIHILINFLKIKLHVSVPFLFAYSEVCL